MADRCRLAGGWGRAGDCRRGTGRTCHTMTKRISTKNTRYPYSIPYSMEGQFKLLVYAAAGLSFHPQALSSRKQNIVQGDITMPITSIAMLDKDHHIHLIPGRPGPHDEHRALGDQESGERAVRSRMFHQASVEGFPHPLEDVIRFTFAATEIPGQQMMTELAFLQNHIVKFVFDKGLADSALRARLALCKGMRDHPFVRDKDGNACFASSRRCLHSTGHYRIGCFCQMTLETSAKIFYQLVPPFPCRYNA